MRNILFIFLGLLPLTVHAQDFTRPSMKTFSAKVANVRLAADLLDKGKKMEDMVSVKASAIIFSQPIQIPDARKAKKYNQQAIDTFVKYISTCIDGTAADLTKFWVKSERSEQLALFSDPSALKLTHEQFKDNPGVTIVGLIFKGQETIVLTRGVFTEPEYVLGVSLLRVDGNTFLTNITKEDLDLAIIEASFLRSSK